MTKKPDPSTDDMSFWEHLDVLRASMFRSLIAVAVFAVVAFFMKSFIYDVIILGPKNSDFFTNAVLCDLGQNLLNTDKLCINTIDFKIHNFDVGGQFKSHLLITFVAAIILAMPYIVAEIWWFIKPALNVKERKYSSVFMIVTNFLFIAGVAFGYYLIVPLAINFLVNYQLSDDIENVIQLGSYIKTVVMISLSTGIVFQLPVLIYFLSKLGIVDDKVLKAYRRHAIVVFFLLSAVITPPDVISQFLVALPLLGLYEISILISKRVTKARIQDL